MFENKEVLILLRFGIDGSLHSYVGHPRNLPVETLREYVRIYLASVSISEPLHGGVSRIHPIGDCRTSRSDYGLGRVTTVSLDGSTVLTASPTGISSPLWEGFLINPFNLHDVDAADAMLPSLRHLADDLILTADHDRHDKLFTLWKGISAHVTGNWWGDDSRSAHLRRAMVSLAEVEVYGVPKDESNDLEEECFIHMTRLAENLRGAIARVSGERHSELCVLVQNGSVAYADHLSIHQTASVVWYFNNVLSIGPKKSHQQIAELSDGGVVHLWHRWKDFVLCAQFHPKTFALPKDYQHVRQYAVDLMEGLGRYSTGK